MRFVAAAVLACALGGAPAIARAQDFAADAPAWNSVSEWVGMASARAIEVRRIGAGEQLDLGTLRPIDSVVLFHPNHPPPAAELTRFLRAGGRVLLADDFGQGTSLLAAFEIGRAEPTRDRTLQLRGNAELLVARARSNHRLAQGVRALVTNHPAIVYHRALSPVFELGAGEAVVLAGAVESGRLVVLSDPSVLIDNMLELRGNRAFAENLVAYLDEARGGTLYVLAPEARVVGRWGEPGADRPLHDLRVSLRALAGVDLPPVVMRLIALALLAALATLALGRVSWASPYRSDRMFAQPTAQGGFAGRVRYSAEHRGNLLLPLLTYRFELEGALLRGLSLSGRPSLRDVLAAMRARGIGDEDVNATRALLVELDRLRELDERQPRSARVSAERFRELVATGDRLLERLGPRKPEARA